METQWECQDCGWKGSDLDDDECPLCASGAVIETDQESVAPAAIAAPTPASRTFEEKLGDAKDTIFLAHDGLFSDKRKTNAALWLAETRVTARSEEVSAQAAEYLWENGYTLKGEVSPRREALLVKQRAKWAEEKEREARELSAKRAVWLAEQEKKYTEPPPPPPTATTAQVPVDPFDGTHIPDAWDPFAAP